MQQCDALIQYEEFLFLLIVMIMRVLQLAKGYKS